MKVVRKRVLPKGALEAAINVGQNDVGRVSTRRSFDSFDVDEVPTGSIHGTGIIYLQFTIKF